MSPISVSSAAEVLEAERATYVDRTPKSAEQFKRRLNAFPGGDTRLVTFYPPHPAQIERATGIDMEDLDGNHYADFLQNYTSMITGHRHPAVMEAAIEMMGQLTGAAAPVPNQLELAEEIIRRVDSIERIRFTNSGTEAIEGSLKLAAASPRGRRTPRARCPRSARRNPPSTWAAP